MNNKDKDKLDVCLIVELAVANGWDVARTARACANSLASVCLRCEDPFKAYKDVTHEMEVILRKELGMEE